MLYYFIYLEHYHDKESNKHYVPQSHEVDGEIFLKSISIFLYFMQSERQRRMHRISPDNFVALEEHILGERKVSSSWTLSPMRYSKFMQTLDAP